MKLLLATAIVGFFFIFPVFSLFLLGVLIALAILE